jgi:hypothetical protein
MSCLPSSDIDISQASKIVLRYPIVPIFAELSTKSPTSATSAPRNNKPCDQISASMSKSYDIVTVSNDVKASCEEYLSRLFFLINLVRVSPWLWLYIAFRLPCTIVLYLVQPVEDRTSE